MIIVPNAYPWVGKLTIGRELASLLGGRLLDQDRCTTSPALQSQQLG
jgi:shikimate kinase